MRSVFGWGLSAAALCVALDLVGAALAGWRWRADYEWLFAVSVAVMFALGGVLAIPGVAAARRWPMLLPVTLALAGLPLVIPATSGPSWLFGLAVVPALVACPWAFLRSRGLMGGDTAGWLVGWIAVFVAVPASLFAAAPGEAAVAPSESAPPSSDLPDVVLVVMDAVRADHLELYGYDRKTMPWLTGFASQATLYLEASAGSPSSLSSHASLFTGLLPPQHLARFRRSEDPRPVGAVALAQPLAETYTTLAEVLQGAGYDTAGFPGNTVALDRRLGLAQGFGRWLDVAPQAGHAPVGATLGARLSRDARLELFLQTSRARLGSELLVEIERWLGQSPSRPRFLFVNFMEAHAPNTPLFPFREAFPMSWGPPEVNSFDVEAGTHLMTERERQGVRDAYDAELLSLDLHLATLFGRLLEAGVLRDALVIITADHGEGLGEHGHLAHDTSLFDSEIRVPLIVKFPHQIDAVRVSEGVHLADVLPTVLEALGLPIPPTLSGVPLQRPADRTRFAWLQRSDAYVAGHPAQRDHQQAAAFSRTWKLIRWGDGSFHLYDLARDPGEKFDVADQTPEIVEAYRAELVRQELSFGEAPP